MKEIKVWQIIMIWLLIPLVTVTLIDALRETFSLSWIFSDVSLDFFACAVTLWVILKVGRVDIELILSRCGDAKKKWNMKEVLVVIVTQIILSLGLSNLSIGLLAMKNSQTAIAMMNETLANPTNVLELIFFMMSIVIVVPVMEEIIFRRVLFTRFSRNLGFIAAAILSSIIFGMGHISLAILGAVAFGIACCILYKKYNNIVFPIVVHTLNNLSVGIILVISYFRGEFNQTTEMITAQDIEMYLISGGIMTVISTIIFIKFMVKNKQYMVGSISENLV